MRFQKNKTNPLNYQLPPPNKNNNKNKTNTKLEVRHLASGRQCFKGTVGGTVNNALHVGRHPGSGELRLYVCNNDDSVKVFALPSMAPLATIRTPVPANYAALSPDGAHLVVVGDCSSTLLYEAGPAGA